MTRWKPILVASVSVLALTACYYKSDDNSPLVRVVNSCEVSVAVSVGDHADSYRPDDESSLMRVVSVGSQEDLVEPHDYPLYGALYVWVVVPGAEARGKPQVVSEADVGETTTSKGAHLYIVEISGGMCPH